MDTYGQLIKEWSSRWQALSGSRKAALAAGSVFCLAFVGLLWWVSRPEYRVLYTGLSAEEAGAITSKLQAKGVSFKLAAGGTTILVPTEQAMQVHLDLTTEGTAGSSKIGKGLDLFDQPMLGATPFNQHINFLRAQQAELARTIMQIDSVLYARVHIVRPEPSPFIRDQKPTTASVMLKLRPGAALNRSTITGIAALVSGSIEGLAKESVRIVDANGRLLSDNNDPDSGQMGTFIEQRKEVEHYLGSEAERVLTHVLGPGRAIVRVTAELNTKLMREKKEIINAEGRVARTEKITVNKTTSSGGSGKGGAVGTSSNFGKPGGGSGGSGSTTNQETQQSDYDYPRTIQEWQNKQGSIERLTIAAFVDTSGANGDPPITLADIKEIIKKAVGFKIDRDEIQVTQVRVPTAALDTSEDDWTAQQRWQSYLTLVRNGSIAAIILCVGAMVWFSIRRITKASPVAAAVPQEKLRRITETLDRNPEMIAILLSRWLERSNAADRTAA